MGGIILAKPQLVRMHFLLRVAIKSVSYGHDYDKVLDKTTLVIYNK